MSSIVLGKRKRTAPTAAKSDKRVTRSQSRQRSTTPSIDVRPPPKEKNKIHETVSEQEEEEEEECQDEKEKSSSDDEDAMEEESDEDSQDVKLQKQRREAVRKANQEVHKRLQTRVQKLDKGRGKGDYQVLASFPLVLSSHDGDGDSPGTSEDASYTGQLWVDTGVISVQTISLVKSKATGKKHMIDNEDGSIVSKSELLAARAFCSRALERLNFCANHLLYDDDVCV